MFTLIYDFSQQYIQKNVKRFPVFTSHNFTSASSLHQFHKSD